LAINWLIVGNFAFATLSLGVRERNGPQHPSLNLVRTITLVRVIWACRPASPCVDDARNLARLFHAQNEIAPSAKLRQGALPFGRTRCG
jgi:hypothetical protein